MTTTTKNTIPQDNSTFLADLQNFLREEDPDRFQDMFTGFIVSGGTHVTGSGLLHSPDSLTAYPGGHFITETGAITYPDSTTHIWVICHKDTTTAITDWTRVSGTHYLFRNTGSATRPTLPVVETAILMKVTTSGGAVTAVQDARILRPWGPLFFDPSIPRAGVSSDQALITDGLFHVVTASAGTVTADTDADDIVIENSVAMGTTWLSPNTATISLKFGDPEDAGMAAQSFDHTTDQFEWKIGGKSSLILNEFGGATFNGDVDFRVESVGNPGKFLVLASTNSVHIDNSLSAGVGAGDLVMASNKRLRWINNAGTTSANQFITLNASDELELNFETAPIVVGTFTPSHKFPVTINGTDYHIQLDIVPE